MSQHVVDNGQWVMTESGEAQESGSPDEEEVTGEQRVTGAGRAPGEEDARRGGGDATLQALDALSDALEQMAKDQKLLEQRLGELRRQRAQGRPWREILSEEEGPGTMQVVSRMLAGLAKASGTLRKELVDTLRREGVSIPAIARMFGVTHQRVSNLLRRPPEQVETLGGAAD